MGMLVSEMKKGLKCRVEGPTDIGNPLSPYLSSLGIIKETPNKNATHVRIELVNGPSHSREECMVPVGLVYWVNQNTRFPKTRGDLISAAKLCISTNSNTRSVEFCKSCPFHGESNCVNSLISELANYVEKH